MRLVRADKHRCEGLWTRVQEERRRGVGGVVEDMVYGWNFQGIKDNHETASSSVLALEFNFQEI